MMSRELNKLVENLVDANELSDDNLTLRLDDFVLSVRSNSTELIQHLRTYFDRVVCADDPSAVQLVAIERSAPSLDLQFKDWTREFGKSGRKDSYADVENTRVVHKVRTGMVFLQSHEQKIAAGPCLQNDNQVINFINAQIMNHLQNQGYAICHAAAVVVGGSAIGMSGFSGGGKSTLMLQMLIDEHVDFMTNDRLFVKPINDHAVACGVPKLPRVNPGTIVHHPILKQMITEAQCQQYLTIPASELWDLEEKYDVMVEELFGKNRIQYHAPMKSFLVLNWERNSPEKLNVELVDLTQRRDLLQAIMKSPGPFYQHSDQSFHQDSIMPDEERYIAAFESVAVYEVKGGVDFSQLAKYCLAKLM